MRRNTRLTAARRRFLPLSTRPCYGSSCCRLCSGLPSTTVSCWAGWAVWCHGMRRRHGGWNGCVPHPPSMQTLRSTTALRGHSKRSRGSPQGRHNSSSTSSKRCPNCRRGTCVVLAISRRRLRSRKRHSRRGQTRRRQWTGLGLASSRPTWLQTRLSQPVGTALLPLRQVLPP